MRIIRFDIKEFMLYENITTSIFNRQQLFEIYIQSEIQNASGTSFIQSNDYYWNGDTKMSLGNNISFLRKQKKLTQEQLADRMRVTRQTVSRWESDEVIPELDRLVEMCGLFACKLDALVREDLTDQSEVYSKIQIKRIAPFKMASYVIISQNPESGALGYMDVFIHVDGVTKADAFSTFS